jgi:(2Fe-2S) ferredoxin
MDAPYKRQLFVCTYGAWCRVDGADEIRAALKGKVHEAGLGSEVRVTKSGCFGQCGHGPMMVMWPDNVWYAKVTLADVDELFASHIVRATPVERLRYHPARPGSNKTPEIKAREAEKGMKVE